MKGASKKNCIHKKKQFGRPLETKVFIPLANPFNTETSSNRFTNMNRLLSKPALTTTFLNIEGLSQDKEVLLSELCKKTECDILVIQETHRGLNSRRPRIQGMNLILERPHEQYGSAIFAKPGLIIHSAHLTEKNNIEILAVELQSIIITSVYKPPTERFIFEEPLNFRSQNLNIVLGDFNCHSSQWGYKETDENGILLEAWAEGSCLRLVHDPKLPSSFNSGRWNRGYNPDNIFVSETIADVAHKTVGDPLPKTQHRPITCCVSAVIMPESVPFKRRFNFSKADWASFSSSLDEEVTKIPPNAKSYDSFMNIIKITSRKYIPRGCRENHIKGLTDESKQLLERYTDLYSEDPFSEDTIQAGEQVLKAVSSVRTEKWCKLLSDLDMKQNSRRAWKLLGNLSNDPTKPQPNLTLVTANQVAHQLLLNGKTTTKQRVPRISRDLSNETNVFQTPFSVSELEDAITTMKTNKAAGLDDIRMEQIKQFGPNTMKWITDLMNSCIYDLKIPTAWRKARVVALLKPGKDPSKPSSFRPVSLLCHLYKILERMVLKRIAANLDDKLIPEQAGFRSGKSCTSQVLNLTQHIEDGYEGNLITGVAFVDLSAAYDTVNHRKLIHKVYQTTKDFQLTSVIRMFLANRKFFVTLNNKNSRWRDLKNGLPQGSVLAPILYNLYTNDQPINPSTRSFIYADDTAIAAQGKSFEAVEEKLIQALEELAEYYDNNHLKPNPDKTQVCAFHLRNREAKRKLKITWRNRELESCEFPKYLGVTLDRTLSFRKHCQNTKLKVHSRNSIVRKLTGTKWGASPSVLRTSALALCFSAGEYAAPVWTNSAHTKLVDTALNETVRIVTGCLRPTPVEKMYPLSGIAPPDIRRQVIAEQERRKQITDPKHPLYSHTPARARLKSRKCFLRREPIPENATASSRRVQLWKKRTKNSHLKLKEELAPGYTQSYTTWRTLNRLRTGVTRCLANLKKWNFQTADELCVCGEKQTDQHLLKCHNLKECCTVEDLYLANDKAIAVAKHWVSI